MKSKHLLAFSIISILALFFIGCTYFNLNKTNPSSSSETIHEEISRFPGVSPQPLASSTIIIPSKSLSYTYSHDYLGDDVTFSYPKSWQKTENRVSGALDFTFTQKNQIIQVDLDCGHDLNYQGMIGYINDIFTGWDGSRTEPKVALINIGKISDRDFGSFRITDPNNSTQTQYADVVNAVNDYRCQMIILGSSEKERQIVDEMLSSVVITHKQVDGIFAGTVWVKDEDNNQDAMTLTLFTNPRNNQHTYYLREQYAYNGDPQDTTITGTWKILHGTQKHPHEDVYVLSSDEMNHPYFLKKDADHLEVLDRNESTITGVNKNLVLSKKK